MLLKNNTETVINSEHMNIKIEFFVRFVRLTKYKKIANLRLTNLK